MHYYLVEYLARGAVALRSEKVTAIKVGFYPVEALATARAKAILHGARAITPVFFECNGQYWTLYSQNDLDSLRFELKQQIHVSVPTLAIASSDDILEEFFDEIK